LGSEADELSPLAPWCLERAPKRRLGDEFMQLGNKQLRVVDVIGAVLREVVNEALALSGGETPSEIRLTHPASWGQWRLERLRQAASRAGIANPRFIPEPVAAAVHFASERLSTGQHVAVYDLGGGTFDTAVLERTSEAFTVIGKPGGVQELGGEDFDDLLYRHLGEQLDDDTWHRLRHNAGPGQRAWPQANRELLRNARRAKEGLSRRSEYEFYMPQPIDREFQASVQELEQLIAPALRGTVEELQRTITATGLEPADLEAIYLAGGSSRISLVGRIIQERLGVVPSQLDDPKAVIALGAAALGSTGAAATETHVGRGARSEARAIEAPDALPLRGETVAAPGSVERAGATQASPHDWSRETPAQPAGAGQHGPPPADRGSSPVPVHDQGGHGADGATAAPPPMSRAALWRSDIATAIGEHKFLIALVLLLIAAAAVAALALRGQSQGSDDLLQSAFQGNLFETANCQARAPAGIQIDEQSVCTPTDADGSQKGAFRFYLFGEPQEKKEAYGDARRLAIRHSAARITLNDCDRSKTSRDGYWYQDAQKEEVGGQALCYTTDEGVSHLVVVFTRSSVLMEGVGPDSSVLWDWFEDRVMDDFHPPSGDDTA
jgi:hypothetical protein